MPFKFWDAMFGHHSPKQDRKSSQMTLNSDSGICTNNYDPGSVSDVSSINDDRENEVVDNHLGDNDAIDADVTFRDQPDMTYRHRVSLDHHEHINTETNKFVVGKSRHRRSCSLPDILDFENCEIFEEYRDTPSPRPSNEISQSDSNLEIKASPDLSSTPKTNSVPLCGKEHVEKPSYICLKDNEIYCGSCVQIHNYHCKENVKHIPEIAPEVRANLCRDAVKELKVMKERFDKVKHENDKILERMEQSRKTFVRSIMSCKNKVLEILNDIEKDALLQMDAMFLKQKTQTDTNLRTLEHEIVSMESYLKILEETTSDGVNSAVYELQAAMLLIRKDESLIRDIHKATYETTIKFETLGPLAELLSGGEPDQYWSISKTPSEKCRHPNPCTCDRSYRNKVGVKEKEISVRLSGWSFDRERCCITGCEFLPCGKLIVCDNGNKKVKLFDRKFKCLSAHNMHSLPWDVAVISDDQVVITVPDKKQLSFLSIGSHRISTKKSVTLEQHCWGVAYSESQGYIYVTNWSRDKTGIQILDSEGNELRKIVTIDRQYLHTPWFIDAYKDTMLVSDWGTFMLTSATLEGLPVFSYRKSDLVGPLGITRDPEGTYYVCGRDSNNIHQISADGSENRVFLSENDGIRQPLNICHRVSDDKLVVTSWMSDKMTVFRLQ